MASGRVFDKLFGQFGLGLEFFLNPAAIGDIPKKANHSEELVRSRPGEATRLRQTGERSHPWRPVRRPYR